MGEGTVRVEGLKDLERSFRLIDNQETKLLRKGLKLAAQPVKVAAEGKALSGIRRMPFSPKWSLMRIGQARNIVYMVPKQKGVRGKGPRRRPNVNPLLLNRAMIPALQQHAGEVEREVQHVLDTVGRQWERV